MSEECLTEKLLIEYWRMVKDPDNSDMGREDIEYCFLHLEDCKSCFERLRELYKEEKDYI